MWRTASSFYYEGDPATASVIEGACHHLVKDRMDITGARWGAEGAEAVLKRRTLGANGDFEQHWRSPPTRTRPVHEASYANNIPQTS